MDWYKKLLIETTALRMIARFVFFAVGFHKYICRDVYLKVRVILPYMAVMSDLFSASDIFEVLLNNRNK